MPRRSARFAAWLGILAISLVMLMPLGSQLMAQASQADPVTDVLCSAAGHDVAPDVDHDIKRDISDDTRHDTGYDSGRAFGSAHFNDVFSDAFGNAARHALAMHLDACGYCSLLAHLPVLTFTAPLTVIAANVTYRAYLPRRAPDGARQARHMRRLSRAPPIDA